MPHINEYLSGFGLTDLLLTLIILAVILVAREEKRIFRRKK
ncbi:MAG TPA: hypothetical protein PLZ86_01880 [bacterium]|nr:hypothetical protein [bacterium]